MPICVKVLLLSRAHSVLNALSACAVLAHSLCVRPKNSNWFSRYYIMTSGLSRGLWLQQGQCIYKDTDFAHTSLSWQQTSNSRHLRSHIVQRPSCYDYYNYYNSSHIYSESSVTAQRICDIELAHFNRRFEIFCCYLKVGLGIKDLTWNCKHITGVHCTKCVNMHDVVHTSLSLVLHLASMCLNYYFC